MSAIASPIGAHHRHVDQHLLGIVPAAASARIGEHSRVVRAQPGALSEFLQQAGPCVRHDPGPVRVI
jgi:hypothetical protein